jgi:hypothetical protein
MRSIMRATLVLTVLAVGAGVSACGGSADEQQAEVDRELDMAMAQDSLAPVGDVAQEGQAATEAPKPAAGGGAAAQPTQKPATKPAAKPASQPAAAGPEYETVTAPAGTSFQVRLDQELSTRTAQVGDLFTTTVVTPVTDGRSVVLPEGAKIRGRVTAVQPSGGQGQPAVLKVAFDEVSVDGRTYPVQMTITEATPTTKGRTSTGGKAARIGAGAAAGAILGQIVGKDTKSTLIGAAVGAAAGTAITLGTEDVDAVLAEGSTMTVRLDEPLSVQREI